MYDTFERLYFHEYKMPMGLDNEEKHKIKMRFNVTMTRPTGNSCCSNHFITEVCPSTKHAIRGIVYTSEAYWRTSKCFNVYIVEDVTLII